MHTIESLIAEQSKNYCNLRKYSTGSGLRKKSDLFGDKFLIVVFCVVLLMSILSLFVFLIGAKYGIYTSIAMLMFLGILICTLLYRIAFYIIFSSINFTGIYRKKTDDIFTHHQILYENISKQGSILDILNEISNINNYIQHLKKYRFIWKYTMSPTGVYYMHQFLNKEIAFISIILSDLRSDLTLRLTEQQSTLEQAKSEVSTHIHGTDELNQVSELQRQRLDQQIAQFEELQRVLVKV